MLDIASVHGRFQPPHLDHLEYMLASFNRSKFLVIGITQPDFTHLLDCPEDPHRAEALSNPLSFYERCEAIRRMLISSGISQQRFSFVRFPIEKPNDLLEILNVSVVCFTTIRDSWNLVKVDRLRELGYEVEILWDRSDEAGRNGTEIRRKIRTHDEGWVNDVHPAVADYLVEADIVARMKKA